MNSRPITDEEHAETMAQIDRDRKSIDKLMVFIRVMVALNLVAVVVLVIVSLTRLLMWGEP